MNRTAAENIKEIAEQLDCGFRVFIHNTTKQLLFVPNENNYPDIDLQFWGKELKRLQNNFADYYEIEKWTTSEAFEMMSAFANQVTDNKLKSRLLCALKNNKPFRAFKFIIDNSGNFREQWFHFKEKWQQHFVAKLLDRIKSTNE